MAKSLRALAAVVLVTLLCAVAGEVVLRVAGIGPRGPDLTVNDAGFDPVLGWVRRAGTVTSSEAGHAELSFWPNGQRASWREPQRPAEKRVVVLGCSFSEGYGVRDEETYVWRLNERHPEIRFENLAVSGYGTYQALLRLEALLRDEPPPALVIYAFIGDHERRNVATLKWIESLRTSRGLFAIPPHVTLDGDSLRTHPVGVIAPWPLETRSAWAAASHELWLRIRYWRRGDQKREATLRLIEQMERVARDGGTRLWVVLLNNVPDETRPALAARGLRSIDCVNPDYEHDPVWKVGGVGHPSAPQHERWAECIGRALEADGFTRPRAAAAD